MTALFFPGLPEELWAEQAANFGGVQNLALEIEYRHERQLFTVRVGERRLQRQIFPPRRQRDSTMWAGERLGPRIATGNTVWAIVRGNPWQVFELPERPSAWANPSYVGDHEITRFVGFTD